MKKVASNYLDVNPEAVEIRYLQNWRLFSNRGNHRSRCLDSEEFAKGVKDMMPLLPPGDFIDAELISKLNKCVVIGGEVLSIW